MEDRRMIIFEQADWLTVDDLQSVAEGYGWEPTVLSSADYIGLTQAPESETDAIIAAIESKTGRAPIVADLPSAIDNQS